MNAINHKMDTTWQQLGLGMFSSTSFFFFLLKFILWGGLARKKKGGPRFFLPVCVISVCSRWREGRGRYEMPQVVFFFVLSQVKSISFFSPPFFPRRGHNPFLVHTHALDRETPPCCPAISIVCIAPDASVTSFSFYPQVDTQKI